MIKKILRRLKLIEDFDFEIEIKRPEFVEKLSNKLEDYEFSIMSEIFEIFDSGPPGYKGKITNDDFEIKRKRELFNYVPSIPIVKGRFKEDNNRLLIHTEIRGLRIGMIILLSIIFSILTLLACLVAFSNNKEVFPAIFFLVFPIPFIAILHYFQIRHAIVTMKRDLERELYFISKK